MLQNFRTKTKKQKQGYYTVKLDDDNIFAEMTATKRVGFHRYTFPKSKDANIVAGFEMAGWSFGFGFEDRQQYAYWRISTFKILGKRSSRLFCRRIF